MLWERSLGTCFLCCFREIFFGTFFGSVCRQRLLGTFFRALLASLIFFFVCFFVGKFLENSCSRASINRERFSYFDSAFIADGYD